MKNTKIKEVNLGEILTIDNISGKCVIYKSNYNICNKCAFSNRISCKDIACMSYQRTDKLNIYFIKIVDNENL